MFENTEADPLLLMFAFVNDWMGLRKVNWAMRPSRGAGPFLAGVQAAVVEADGGIGEFTKVAAREGGSGHHSGAHASQIWPPHR